MSSLINTAVSNRNLLKFKECDSKDKRYSIIIKKFNFVNKFYPQITKVAVVKRISQLQIISS